jgi:hypothetical protein
VNSLFRPLHGSRKAAAALIPIGEPMAAFSKPSSVWTNDINNHPKKLFSISMASMPTIENAKPVLLLKFKIKSSFCF